MEMEGSTSLIGEDQKANSFLEMSGGCRHLLCKIRPRWSLHSLEKSSIFVVEKQVYKLKITKPFIESFKSL